MTKPTVEELAKQKGIPISQLRSLACKVFGAVGGKSGTGEAKRRDPEHYRKMVKMRNRQRKLKALQAHHENTTNGAETPKPKRQAGTNRQRAN